MAEHRLIYGFFWLLAAIVFCAGCALVVLDVNDVVRVNDGELLSGRPRFVARAPFLSRVDTVLVKEGTRVKRGALLLVLKNDEVNATLSQARAEEQALSEELAQVERQLGNTSERGAAPGKRNAGGREKWRLERQITIDGARALAEQRVISRQQDSLMKETVERARALYARGMLSRAELDDAQRALLEKRNASLAMDAARLALVERAQRLRRTIEKQRDEVRLRANAAAREEVRADIDGTVRYVYNTKSARDFLDAGEVLVEVSPPDDSASSALYARLKVDQQAVKQLRPGQQANLRLDAYQFYRYGGLRGSVRYVSPPSDDNEFFAVVDLERRNDLQLRPGYRVRGGIVVGRLSLYEYIVKTLFMNMEPTPPVPADSARVASSR